MNSWRNVRRRVDSTVHWMARWVTDYGPNTQVLSSTFFGLIIQVSSWRKRRRCCRHSDDATYLVQVLVSSSNAS